jgi:DNA-directed RNA polymerase subunit omega
MATLCPVAGQGESPSAQTLNANSYAHEITKNMNATLVKKALEIVLNPNVLVNMVSQRVRQLNSGVGGRCRPLLADVANLSAADIALSEIIEDKMSFEAPEILELTRPTGKNRRRPQHWTRA